MSDLSHLAEDYRERAMWADNERIAWIRMDRWLGFPKAENVRTTLDTMLRYPPRTRMPCLLIYGQTGMGKSRIVERFEAGNPRGFNDTTETATIPVVAVQLPPQPTDGEFGSVAKIVKLEHAWRRLNGWSDDGFQVAPFPG